MLTKLKPISGYAETKFVNCHEIFASDLKNIRDTLIFAKKNSLSICCKGGGYSYGDSITNEKNIILNTSKMNKILNYDKDNGLITVEPGVSIAQILEIILTDNWTISANPGSFDVTIGGAISNNIHGKDSYSEGNFISNVKLINVLLSSGDEIICSREENIELFNYIHGGMGLFGIITKIILKLKKIPSPYVEKTNFKAKDINELIKIFEYNKNKYDFMVAWVDAFAKGKSLGRGFIECGKWTNKSSRETNIEIKESLTKSTKIFNLLPKELTWMFVKPFFNRFFLKLFNIFFYNYNSIFKSQKIHKILYTKYNFIHNYIPDFKNLFRPYGFIELQPLIPVEKSNKCMRLILRLCQKYQFESMLAGFKLHRKDGTSLSYSLDGYSIGIVLSLKKSKNSKISQFTSELFEIINKFNGIIYLAKDEVLSKKYFNTMYPNHKEFNIIKKKYDPNNLFNSDLYKRLIN